MRRRPPAVNRPRVGSARRTLAVPGRPGPWPRRKEADVGMRVPDLGSLLSEVQARRMALDATGSYFVNEIDAPHAEDFAKSILLMSIPRRGQRDQPITVYINSGGRLRGRRAGDDGDDQPDAAPLRRPDRHGRAGLCV